MSGSPLAAAGDAVAEEVVFLLAPVEGVDNPPPAVEEDVVVVVVDVAAAVVRAPAPNGWLAAVVRDGEFVLELGMLLQFTSQYQDQKFTLV